MAGAAYGIETWGQDKRHGKTMDTIINEASRVLAKLPKTAAADCCRTIGGITPLKAIRNSQGKRLVEKIRKMPASRLSRMALETTQNSKNSLAALVRNWPTEREEEHKMYAKKRNKNITQINRRHPHLAMGESWNTGAKENESCKCRNKIRVGKDAFALLEA